MSVCIGKWRRLRSGYDVLLDRGDWGAQYLLDLHEKYGIGVVTRAQARGLEVVDYIET